MKKETAHAALDSTDLKILKQLQDDGRISNARLSETVNLSETPCWRRWKKLEDNGYINEYRAVLNPRKMGFKVKAFTQVTFASHDVDLTDEFEKIVSDLDWVQSCHCITGSVDYVLQMVFRDLDEFSDRINVIRRIPGVNAVQSHISVKEIKASSRLPVGDEFGV